MVDTARGLHRILATGQARPLLAWAGQRVAQWLGHGSSPTPAPTEPGATGADAASLRVFRDHEYGERIEAYDREIEPYAGMMVLYRAMELRRPTMPLHGFDALVRGRQIACDVPGTHDTMLRAQNVGHVARHLSALLTALPQEEDRPRPGRSVSASAVARPRLVRSEHTLPAAPTSIHAARARTGAGPVATDPSHPTALAV